MIVVGKSVLYLRGLKLISDIVEAAEDAEELHWR